MISILTALYLGSWWALQEGSWGGWWNWDASEFLGLLVLYLILTIFHNKSNLSHVITLFYSIRLSLSYLFIYFFLLQLNFSIISHNFGFRTLKFLNTEVLLFSFLSYFICSYTFLKNSEQNLWTQFYLTREFIITRWHILYVCICTFNFVVLVSLLSFFFKTLFEFFLCPKLLNFLIIT